MIGEILLTIFVYAIGILATIGALVLFLIVWSEWLEPKYDKYKSNRNYKYSIDDIVLINLPIGDGEYKKTVCKIYKHKYDRMIGSTGELCGRVYRVLFIETEHRTNNSLTEYEEELFEYIRWV